MSGDKILFLGKGSESDPPMDFAKSYFDGSDVKVIGPYVSSCHGCYELMEKLYAQLQTLADKNVKVVSIEEGGLYFAKPSIAASKTTFPIISRPLDLAAYQGYRLPSGNAVISTVGVDKKSEGKYFNFEGAAALVAARSMLELEGDTVELRAREDVKPLIQKELDSLGIRTSGKSKLVLNYNSVPNHVGNDQLQIWADPEEDLFSGSCIQELEDKIKSVENTVQVFGGKNIAYYAAKILSFQRPDIREKLKAAAEKKRKSYADADVLKDLGL